VADVVSGKADLDQLLQRRGPEPPSIVKVAPTIAMDNESSSHSTLMEVVAQDRPGLLHLIASEISEHACNIELALIDTEGQTAIDVFYVTKNGKKLSSSMAKGLQKSLLKELAEA
jgi:[protein-PII] uridylyltransferase